MIPFYQSCIDSLTPPSTTPMMYHVTTPSSREKAGTPFDSISSGLAGALVFVYDFPSSFLKKGEKHNVKTTKIDTSIIVLLKLTV